ncbi:response regulator [Alteromonas sediminis]|uniref:histidine kinase n=1 Tax=Alteromonas sediminis TaxID=2259342 RepID=A0A3N5Y1R3_9ALTE|nr:PAS domain-containing protein [Alteromonas sediminis]RPJ67632.1 response regulator [Alteromonas sediminis]
MNIEKLISSNKDGLIALYFEKGIGWHSSMDESRLLIPTETDFCRRIEHTRKWCFQHTEGHAFFFPYLVKAGERQIVKARKVTFSLLSADSLGVSIEPEQDYDDIVFSAGDNFNLLEAMNDVVLIAAAQSHEHPSPPTIYVNDAFERMTGYSAAEIIGKTPAEILQGEETEDVAKRNIRDGLKNWQHVNQRLTNYKKNGEKFVVELTISPVVDKTGWYESWISVQRNISQEYSIDNYRRRNELALEAAGIGTWTWNLKNNTIEWDERMYTIYGLAPSGGALQYNDWAAYLDPEDRLRVEKEIALAVEHKLEWESSFRINKISGEPVYVSAKAKLYNNVLDDSWVMVGVNIDRTNEERAKQELDEQKKLALNNAKLASLGEIAAGVAHEINNPLAVISGVAELMEARLVDGKLATDKTIDGFRKIQKACERISTIVHGLRAASSMSDDSIKLKTLDLFAELQQCLPLFTKLYSKHNVEIYLKPFDGHCLVKASSAHIQQILINLMNNAKDALKLQGGGKIELEVVDFNSFWRVKVADNGPGIPDDFKHKIFEPFVTSKGVGDGSGLGLSISHKLANDMDGALSFDSSVEHGALFFLDLQKAKQADNEKLSVLVIDDDTALVDVLEEMFDYADCEVFTAYDGAEAIDAITQGPKFDFIFCDIQMPKMNGLEFIEWLAENKKIKHSLIYILTAEEGNLTPQDYRLIDSVCEKVLRKPLKINQLKSIIRQ